MPITNKANIWMCSNNVNLHSFKEPIPTVWVLILNKCKCDWNYLFVAIYPDYGEYLTFISSSKKCAINAYHRKTVLKCSYASTKAKEGSLQNALSPSHSWYEICVIKAPRIPSCNLGHHARQVIVWCLICAKSHLEHLLFSPPCLQITNGVLVSLLNVSNNHFWLII